MPIIERKSPWLRNGADIYYNQGNVGIGTTVPRTKLDFGSVGVNSPSIYLYDDGTSVDGWGQYTSEMRTFMDTAAGTKMTFGTQTLAGTFTELMRLQGGGNVGIGTTNPTSLFSVGSTSQFQVNSSGLALHPAGSAASPSVSFVADPDTGIYNSGANLIDFVTAGVLRWEITAAGNLAAVDNLYDIGGNGGNRPRTIYPGTSILNVLGSVGAPTYSFAGDPNTGEWSPGADIWAVSTGGGERVRIGSDSLDLSVFLHGKVTAGITASTTQTQGNGALTAEINEVSVVANINDTVTLPTAVAGRRCVIINNGANTLQIFPASGDNLGAGVDTATTLAAGSNIVYQAYNVTNWEVI